MILFCFSIWLGATDEEIESVFVWVDDGDEEYKMSWTNWKAEEPVGSQSQNCLIRQGSDGKWDDKECARNFPYFCETITREYLVILHFPFHPCLIKITCWCL